MTEHAQDNYPTDLTDGQWQRIEPLLSAPKSGPGKPGRPSGDRRQIVNGILYVVKSGCQWRMLLHEYGCWQTVYRYFNGWSRAKVWQRIMDVLTRQERQRQGRHPEPTAGCIDSQSVKAATQPVDDVGVDGNKKIKGRKRHVLTDTLGFILCVVVTAANVGDRAGLKALLGRGLSKAFDGCVNCGWTRTWARSCATGCGG